MIGSERLAAQLAHLAQQAGAISASVYLPTPWNAAAPMVLVHAGRDLPLPELATPAAAEAFAAEVVETGAWNGQAVTADGLVTSKSGEGVLIAAPLLTSLWAGVGAAAAPGGFAQRRSADHRRMAPAAGWVALRMPPPLVSALGGGAMVAVAHALASTIVCVYSVLTDPLTGLPGRHELMGVLRTDLDRARRRRLPCALLLVNPLGIEAVNEQFGRRAGDGLIREVVQTMQGMLRRSDVLMRYGGAIFALPLGNVGADAAVLVAERVRQHVAGRPFLQDSVHLRCAVGAVACDPLEADTLEPLDLLKRANEALALGRQQNGDDVVLWHDAAAESPGPSTDRLLGIFTGRSDKDYRNMGLLWDVLRVLSSAAGSTDLAAKVVERLFAVLHPARAALFVTSDAGERLLFGQQRPDERAVLRQLQPGDLTEDERAVVSAAVDAGTVQQRSSVATGPDGERRSQLAVGVPLITDGRTLGAICLVGSPEVLDLDRTDVHVLTGVAGQLAVALDREHLAERARVHAEHERRRLQAEVQGLKSQQSPIVFQSTAMADLLTRARRVAATDATVLVTGESGTGKEMLAQTLHQLSGRRTKPFVIVDCGAIPATLIDSELFGHERGAFTGAQQRSSGRLAMAEGGTVFLDEIGELPLDVQSRLLRFVQEKTISMVGGTRSRKVDVRIVAATNRRLEDEVRAGRFREDLFYRLNVVRLHIPPLRERPEDVRLLAEHFARTAAAEQRKAVVGFTPEAERRLNAYAWPGNIRELQNTILQAVVLSDGDRLSVDDLTLPEPAPDTVPPPVLGGPLTAPAGRVAAPPLVPALPPAAAPASGLLFDEAWRLLHDALVQEVRRAASASPRLSLPLGRWLAHEVVLVAHEQASGVGARAASRIGLPQTTFARRLRQAETDRGLSARPAGWGGVRAALSAVVSAADLPPAPLADKAEDLLLEIVLAEAPSPIGYAAALMGLSPPTMKQRLQARAS
ncbi:MAG: sigma 54-interacting transcriptional regulator [Vicinamibacterales bacterium]